jgi:hypothetical protein
MAKNLRERGFLLLSLARLPVPHSRSGSYNDADFRGAISTSTWAYPGAGFAAL